MKKRYANPSTSLISEVQRYISQTTSAIATHPMVPLPPVPSQTPPIQPIMNTNLSQAGDAFRRRGSCTPHQPTDTLLVHILALSINGNSYNGSIFDSNGNLLD